MDKARITSGRRRLCILLCALMLPVCAAVRAEQVRFGSVTADPAAEYIDMGDEQIADWEAFYSFLRRLPRLRAADLYATPIGRDRITALNDAFPGVTFGMTMRIGDHLVRTDTTAFSTLHTSGSYPHGDDELSLLRYCTGLYALDLGHNLLSDLSFLNELKELRILIVSMNELTDITPIGNLRHLEYLEMFENRITDISCLRGLPFLTDLNLVGNRIESLEVLRGMQGLKRLWMSRCQTRLPASEIRREAEELRAALPGCLVDAASSGIGGGWREHPHYETVRRIFAAGVYEPFDDSPEENRP